MATDSQHVELPRLEPESILSTVSTIKKMLLVGAAFVGVGYLLSSGHW